MVYINESSFQATTGEIEAQDGEQLIDQDVVIIDDPLTYDNQVPSVSSMDTE